MVFLVIQFDIINDLLTPDKNSALSFFNWSDRRRRRIADPVVDQEFKRYFTLFPARRRRTIYDLAAIRRFTCGNN
jgi:hypothetical protein